MCQVVLSTYPQHPWNSHVYTTGSTTQESLKTWLTTLPLRAHLIKFPMSTSHWTCNCLPTRTKTTYLPWKLPVGDRNESEILRRIYYLHCNRTVAPELATLCICPQGSRIQQGNWIRHCRSQHLKWQTLLTTVWTFIPGSNSRSHQIFSSLEHQGKHAINFWRYHRVRFRQKNGRRNLWHQRKQKATRDHWGWTRRCEERCLV